MKKLITTVVGAFAAIASALASGTAETYFGDHNHSGANFEATNYEVGTNFVAGLDDEYNDPSTQSFWWNGSVDDFEGTIAAITGEEGFKYLDFESSITNPLYRTINLSNGKDDPSFFDAAPIGDGIFIDTNVKFTPYEVSGEEDGPTPAGADKLIVWLREMEVPGAGEDAVVLQTNLVVTAGYYTSDTGRVVPTNYVARVNASGLTEGFHRLTIKSFENIKEGGSGFVGFVIYLDDTPLTFPDQSIGLVTGFTSTAGKYVDDEQLLPSLVETGADNAQYISAVGFAGTGAIKDVYFDNYYTDSVNYERIAAFADPKLITVAYTDGVTGFTLTGSDGTVLTVTGLTGAGTTNISLRPSALSIAVSDVNYNTTDGFKGRERIWGVDEDGKFNNIGSLTDDSGSFVLGLDNRDYTIRAFRANYLIGTDEYDTFADAYAALPAEGGTIKLGQNVVFTESLGDASFAGCIYLTDQDKPLTIDLNGHTIRGTSELYATFTVETGSLTVIDSSGDNSGRLLGTLIPGEEGDADTYGDAIVNNYGSVTIHAGTIGTITTETPDDIEMIIDGGRYIVYESEIPASFYLANYVASGLVATPEVDAVTGEIRFVIGEAQTQFGGGTGTALDPYIISEYDHLVELQTKVAAGDTFAGKFFKQTNDVDFAGKDPWAGIGQAKSTSNTFKGVYDGDDNKIINLTLDGDVEYAALFGQIGAGADVKNISEVNIAGVENYKDDTCVGGLVGYAVGAVTVSDIKVTGTLGTTEQPMKDNVSGLICRANLTKDTTAVFTRLEFAGTINAASASLNRKVAGILGYSEGGYVTLDSCVFSGTLVNNASVDFYHKDGPQGGVGGLVSYIWTNGAQGLTVKDCVVSGTITANENVAFGAGVFGAAIGVTITAQGTNKVAKTSFNGLELNGNGNSWPQSYGFEDAEDNTLIDLCGGAFEAGKTYYTVKSGLTPTYQFTEAGTIAFNTNLYAAAAFNVTAAEGFVVDDGVEAAGVVTFTATAAPQGPAVDDGEITGDGQGNYVVTPAQNQTAVTVSNLPVGFTGKVIIPDSVETITGVGADNIQIVSKHDSSIVIGNQYFVGMQDNTFTVELSNAAATAVDETADEPMVVGGETVALTIKVVPGLNYQLIRLGAVDGDWTEATQVAEQAAAKGVTSLTLTDSAKPEGQAFYKIRTTK